jgi:hypothetical protein
MVTSKKTIQGNGGDRMRIYQVKITVEVPARTEVEAWEKSKTQFYEALKPSFLKNNKRGESIKGERG